MMKLGLWAKIALIGVSAGFDILQAVILFQVAMCAVPSLTGLGTVITFICGIFEALAFPLVEAIEIIFALIWASVFLIITREKVVFAVGLAESIPILNGLPLYTASAIWYAIKN